MSEIVNHLWQSTAFILLIALAAKALRRNSARLRYWLWFAASIKFLIPFSLIVSTGARIQLPRETLLPHADTVAQISTYFEPATETYFDPTSKLSAAVPGGAGFSWGRALMAIWLTGVFLLAVRWFHRWWTILRAVGRATRLPIESSVPIFSSLSLMEPGVFGLFRPVLLLPEGIAEKLTPKQFEAILAHELRHIKCFDNLTAAVHMGIETLFWFHPLVWWIGAKLMNERERDCDEAVLKQGSQPADYARGILQVCETYIKTGLPCASGISGSDLKKRVQEIMTWRGSLPVTLRGKAILVSAALAAVSVPFAIGVLRAQAGPSAFMSQSSQIRPETSQDVGFNGVWRTETPGPTVGLDLVSIKLEVDKGKVTGSFQRTDPPGLPPINIVNGTATTDSITFTVKSLDGRRVVTFSGTLKGDEIEFTREAKGTDDGGQGIFAMNGPRTLKATRWSSASLQGNRASAARLKFSAASLRQAEVPGPGNNNQITRIKCLGTDGLLWSPPYIDPTPARQGRCTGATVPLNWLVQAAYGSSDVTNLVGSPFDLVFYQIEAVAEDPARTTKAELQQMLQALLEDRFKAQVHTAVRELDGFALMIARSGIKFKETSEPEFPGSGSPSLHGGYRMVEIVRFLKNMDVPGPIMDKTGLTGLYHMDLTLDEIRNSVDESQGRGGPQTARRAREFTTPLPKAIEDQLGLHLERAKVPVQFIFVDHLELATEN